jgi:hypothetical protein
MEALILAMTKMLSGICTAGFTTEPDPVTGLRWVQPVKEHSTLLPGDMTTADNCLVQCGAVVALQLKAPRPDPPHVEDWLTDFIYHRPRVARRLEGDHRAAFFPRYLDRAPEEVLDHQRRSLCLVRPDRVAARFSLDPYSGKYQARLDLDLGHRHLWNLPVTDLKWRALGRSWLGGGGELSLEQSELDEQLTAKEIYLALGLSRGYQGKLWLMVIGVHVVPDYVMAVDHDRRCRLGYWVTILDGSAGRL